jgi:hypothetical protein
MLPVFDVIFRLYLLKERETMKPIQMTTDVTGKAGSAEIKRIRSAKRAVEMGIKSKLPLAFACMMMSVLVVGCSGDYSPVSPSPVLNEIDVNPPVIDVPTPPAGNTTFEARESFTYHMNAATSSRLRLEGVNGRIRIEGSSDSASVLVTGDRVVRSESKEDARRHLEYLEVRIEEIGGELAVRTVQPENADGRHYEVNYAISLPRSWRVEVQSLNGNVTLSNLHGGARVDLLNGEIAGDLALPMDGAIDLETVNGEVDLRIPGGTSAEFSANVVNGTIDVSGLALRDAHETRTSVQGTLGDGRGRITLRTTNGKISVRAF